MKILLTNDDGIFAPGMYILVSLLLRLGFSDLHILAPAQEQSGKSMAFSLTRDIAIDPYDYPQTVQQAWAVHGTPVDCVKLALSTAFFETPPDIVISGINNGTNAGRNLFYSGTVGAAHEALLRGIPAIALSQCKHISLFQEFEGVEKLLKTLCLYVLSQPFSHPVGLNVNFPATSVPWKGMRLVASGNEFLYCPPCLVKTEGSRRFYSIRDMHEQTYETTSEEYSALADNYISVAPLFVRNSPLCLLTELEFQHMQKTFEHFHLATRT